jgi:hypothetical protein
LNALSQTSTNINLFLNILSFDWAKEKIPLYFSLVEAPRTKRIYKSSFPEQLKTLFPDLEKDKVEFVYTSFGFPRAGFKPLEIELKTTNIDFAKYYYREILRSYFRKKKLIVSIGFIDEIEVWIFSEIQ